MNPFETEWWTKYGPWVFLAVVALFFAGVVYLHRTGDYGDYQPDPLLEYRADFKRWGVNSIEDLEAQKDACYNALLHADRSSPEKFRQALDAAKSCPKDMLDRLWLDYLVPPELIEDAPAP
jgi:hypothetical protein